MTATVAVYKNVGDRHRRTTRPPLCIMALKVFGRGLAVSLVVCSVLASAPSGPWDAFNFAPPSRTVYARYVHQTGGNVTGATDLLSEGSATLSGSGSYVTLDFGYEVRLADIRP